MIRRELTIEGRPAWLLITQPRHAELAWRMAVAREAPACDAAVERQFLYAVRRHDDGWAEVDDEVAFDEAGSPLTFFEFVPRRSVDPWRKGVSLAARGGRFAQWLVAAHFLELGASAEQDVASRDLREFLDEERARQPARLAGIDPALADEMLRQLQLADAASLACCGAFGISREKMVGLSDAAVKLTCAKEAWNSAAETLYSHWEWCSANRPLREPIAWSSPAMLLPRDDPATAARSIRWELSLSPSDAASPRG